MTNLHALIIDDDAMNLDVLGRLLTKEHVTYTAVRDTALVEQAIGQLDHLNVVFLDLEMPKHNGYEVLEFLRPMLGDEVPVVAYTVHTNESDTARQLGFQGFLS